MPSVNFDDEIIDKIIARSNKSEDGRLIGLLIGTVEDESILVSQAIPTRHLKEKDGIKVNPNDIAVIAKQIMDKKLEGNIIGWFHTHPGYGASMSDIDIQTQEVLQQFSPFIVSMVVDPKKNEVKFYTLNGDKKVKEIQRGEIQRGEIQKGEIQKGEIQKGEIQKGEIQKGEKTRMFGNKAAYASRYPSTPSREPLSKRQIYLIITAIIVIGVVISSIFLYSLLTGGITVTTVQTSPVIKHTPVVKGEVGKEITLRATVTSRGQGISNVTVSYEWTERTISDEVLARASAIEHPWKTALMLLIAPEGDEYAYTIPASEVAGDIDYYVTAYSKEGVSVGTSIYTIKIADFQVEVDPESMIVHLGEEKTINVYVRSINDFNSPVELKTEKTPYGIQASIRPTTVTPPKGGESKTTLTISASEAPGTFRGQFDLLVYGKSGKTEHEALIEEIIVPYYEVSVSPLTLTINREETASYDIKITPSEHFSKEIKFSVSGLPSEDISWQLIVKNKRITIASETDLILQIETTKETDTGTYNLTLDVEGGGIKYKINLSLTIKK